MKITIENFDINGKALDSPRSLQACKKQGINPSDLLYKDDKFIL